MVERPTFNPSVGGSKPSGGTMGKQIELTYKNEDGETVTEECLLIEEEDPIFIAGCTEPLAIVTDKGVGHSAGILMEDRVLFEDDEGIFGLRPDQVLNIKHI